MYPTAEAEQLRKDFLHEVQAASPSSKPAPEASPQPAPAPRSAPRSGPTQAAPRSQPETSANYTPDQQEAATKLVELNDYYSILGVGKDAKEDEIKRAFRKLALKFHPDKNAAPQAEAAFKKVNQAYQCLSDADKKSHYDLFGEEEGGGGRAEKKDLTPEDVCNMFFDPDGRPHVLPEKKSKSGVMLLTPLFPLAFLVVFSYFVAISQDQLPYSLHQTDSCTIRRTTPAHTEFFVEPYFEQSYGRDFRALAAVEHEMDHSRRHILEEACNKERSNRSRLLSAAKKAASEGELLMKEAQAYVMPSCDALDALLVRAAA